MREEFLSFNKDQIKEVFNDFYTNLFDDKYIKHFFLSKEQIKNLIEKQIVFIQKVNILFGKDEKQLEDLIKNVVNVHYKENIPFELFLNSLELLRSIFLKKLGTSDSIKLHINLIFDTIEKFSSKAYTHIILTEEKELTMFYQKIYSKLLGKDQFNVIIFHLGWFLYLTESFLQENKDGNFPYLEEENCLFKKETTYQNLLNNSFINRLHKKVHESAYFAYYLFFEKQDYRNFIFAYSNLSKDIYNLTIAIINEFFEKEKEQSVTDPLTGLYNRRILKEVLQYQAKTASMLNLSIGLIMIDIDNFKSINDKYGHTFGDDILTRISDIIKNNIRNSDYAFRYGGEEFLIILPSIDKKNLYEIAEKIRKEVEKLDFKVDGQKVKVTVSLGVAVFEREKLIADLSYMIKAVDNALYLSKNSGKNKTSFNV